jgi:hypothetical protein
LSRGRFGGFGRFGGGLSTCFIGFVGRAFLIAFSARFRHSASVSPSSL